MNIDINRGYKQGDALSCALFILGLDPLIRNINKDPAIKSVGIKIKFEFGGSFGMSLEGDFHGLEVSLNLELLITFGMSLEGVCHGFIHKFITSSYLLWR